MRGRISEQALFIRFPSIYLGALVIKNDSSYIQGNADLLGIIP